MSFSQFAGIAIVPTLARLVLAMVFIAAGWMKFSDAEFDAAAATRLRALGVTVTPAAAAALPTITPAAFRQAAPTTQPTAPATAAATQATVQPPTTQPADAGALAEGKYLAKGLHMITVMVDGQGWPYPTWMAWAAALTELVGGAMMLLGLFARLWGFALSCVMGVAFYLTSLPVLMDVGFFNVFTMPAASAAMFIQIALFVLAFGVLLTGPGPLSLDRMFFGGRREEELPPSKDAIRLPG